MASGIHTSAASRARVFAGAVWRDVQLRRDALPELGRNVLLHAGPPLIGPVPAPIRNAACQALLFDGMVKDIEEAESLLNRGEISLRPAQDFHVATPLAQVVSASMPLAVVGDARRHAYAALIEGSPPAARFGVAHPAVVHKMTKLASNTLGFAPLLRADPVPLDAVIETALACGDECHARVGNAQLALLSAMPWLPPPCLLELNMNPAFVLAILMAAAKWRLDLEKHGIASVGGNGVEFGLRMHGEVNWRVEAALPPLGTRIVGHAQTTALGAIGDSAVLDFCGLGGQAIQLSPTLQEEWGELLPTDFGHRANAILNSRTGLVDTALVREVGRAPLVNLAILDRQGTVGMIGRGFYEAPNSIFAEL